MVLESATQYVNWDPNAETRAEISAHIEAKSFDKLEALLNSRLAFGTAGLRGEKFTAFHPVLGQD
jgi:hypothetical protein